jgi:hypothetical protein|tara:strand:- start:91883 stop:92611 length:729 start_codon:yes stop_codon:yes gene_type:complete
MVKVIGISGRKQSGKNTAANYIAGSILKSKNMIQDFVITEVGSLSIKTTDGDGNVGWGIFDLTRKDQTFTSYAEQEIWPFIKIYHFADPLKSMAVEFFDLTPQQVYGTDNDKNTKTPYSQNGWRHKMTAREFLQYFGTEVMRNIKDSIWVDYTMKRINKEQSSVAIIPDVRFPNEINAIKEAGGIVIRLTRDPFESDHDCEKALDAESFDWDKFDNIIDNKGNIDQLLTDLNKLQKKWGIGC